MGDINFSDIVRKYISDTHQRDPTYFSSKSISERNQDFKVYCELNKNLGLTYKNHRPLFSQLLSKQKDILKLKMDSQQTKTKSEKFSVTKGRQKANITINPTEQQTQITQQTTAQSTGLQIADTSKKTEAPPHPTSCQCTECKLKRGEIQPLEPEEAGAILEIFIDFWHSRNPNVELMTQEEVIRVGKRLAPILQRHLGGDILLYGLGIVTIAQVVMKRYDQAKKPKKDSIEKKRDKANKETSQPQDNAEQEEIINPKTRKFFNKKKLKDIEDLGDTDE